MHYEWIPRRGLAKSFTPQQRRLFLALTETERVAGFVEDVRDEVMLWSEKRTKENDEEAILLGGLDYALGRMTSVVDIVADDILARVSDLSVETKERIVALIDARVKAGNAGTAFDTASWTGVRDTVAESMAAHAP